MIFLVIATLLIYRGAQINTGDFPYAARGVRLAARRPLAAPAGHERQPGASRRPSSCSSSPSILGFGVLVTYSKHLHIVIAPLNVLFSRRPEWPARAAADALATARCSTSRRPTPTPTSSASARSRTSPGRACWTSAPAPSAAAASRSARPGSPASRCRRRCSILDLRDHAFAKAPYLLAELGRGSARRCLTPSRQEAERPLVGDARHGVIDPDVLWSCTNCGACVEECPVDIEHIDHITDMRRYQVLIESAFPSEASGMLRNLENKGNPWGMGESRRAEWITELDFEVPVVDGADRRRRRVPVLGRLRRRARGPGQEDHQGDRRAAAHGRGLVRGARPGRDLHR